MPACTFFGHRDCPASIRPALRAAVIELIEKKGVTEFYVGSQGGFDRMVQSVLRELQRSYPAIRCTIVLAYLPRQPEQSGLETLLPEGIERAPKRFAISWRNRWMLDRSDHVIAYVTRSWGGAAQFAELAKKRGKQVHALAPGSV